MVGCAPMNSLKAELHRSHRTGNLYGSLAYTAVILTSYITFLSTNRFYASEWMVPIVFALGALYAALGVLGGTMLECRGRMAYVAYYLLQCALLTAIIVLSPVRGFLGILVLPVISQ